MFITVQNLEILHRSVPVFALLGVSGALLGLLLVLLRAPRFSVTRDDAAYVYVFAAVGAAMGAKLLYLLTVLDDLYAAFSAPGADIWLLLRQYMSGGLVYYGAILGALLGCFAACAWFSLSPRAMLRVLTPAMPLFHSVARVGCYFTGCCYGVPTQGALCVLYAGSHIAPNGVPLLPVQLIEAVGEFVIFLVVLLYSSPRRKSALSAQVYLLLYAPMRFILEFFRGDAARGHIGALSTSQFLGIFIFAGALLSCLYECGAWGKKAEDTLS